MQKCWLIFWVSCLVAVVSFGAWCVEEQVLDERLRGVELATRNANLPYRLPLAGVNVELTQYEDIPVELDQIADLGFVWVRQPFLWSEIEPEPGEYHWEDYDRVVEAVSENGRVQLIVVLDGSPAWARHPQAPEHPFAPPASPTDYGKFAQAVAERYGDSINYYQIWDEPNIREHWGNLDPRSELYVTMLDAAYDAIHAADPVATVIMAALAPTVESGPENINDPAYLRAIYDLGGGDSFDAVAGKPYGFNAAPDDRMVDVAVTNFSRLILLREVMLEYGDGEKALWGSNFGWNSLSAGWQGPSSIWGQVSLEQQLDYTNRAYRRAAQEWAWVGGLILQHWEPDAPPDDPIHGFAVKPHTDQWHSIIPQHEVMWSGRYPAVNAYAVYNGDWEFGELGADGQPDNPPNTISIPFEGTEFALAVRRGDYLAYLLVEIDGEPANLLPRHNNGDAFIALTSADRQPSVDLIPVAADLGPGHHVAVITHRPEQGQDYWSIAGFAVAEEVPVDKTGRTLAIVMLVISLLTAGFMALRLPWRNLRLPSTATLRNLGDLLLGLLFSLVVMIGTLLTWHDTITLALRRDLPVVVVMLATSTVLYYAPSTWIALLALLITGIIIFNRPLIGVSLTIFWSAFFASNLDPFFRALALVDVVLVITLAAAFARLFYEYTKNGKRPSIASLIWDIQLHPLDIGILALVGLGFLSLTWSEYLGYALRDIRVLIVSPAIFYFVIRLLRPDRRELGFLIETLLFTGFMLAAIGIFNYFTGIVVVTEEGSRRLLSVYGSPNSVGLMLGRILPFALAYLLLPVGEWRKILAGLTGVVMLVAVALSQSVGAIMLGLPAAVAVTLLAWKGRRSLPILGGLAVAGMAALAVASRFLPRLRQITDFENNTTIFRLNLWRSTVQMLQDHPLTGVGMDQFLYAYRSRYLLPEAWRDPDLSHPHNILLDYWVRLGIMGVAVGIILQWLFWRQALRVYRRVRQTDPLKFALVLGAMGAMADFLAHGLVDMAHFSINLSYVFALLLALVVELEQTEDGLSDSNNASNPQ